MRLVLAPIIGAAVGMTEAERNAMSSAVCFPSAFRAVACASVAPIDDASFAVNVYEPKRPAVNGAVAWSSAFRAVACVFVAAIDIAPRINNVLHPQWLTMDTAMARGFTENAKFGLFITPNLNAKYRHRPFYTTSHEISDTQTQTRDFFTGFDDSARTNQF